MTTTETTATSASSSRRHDLDALRGFAMLLGIVLHAAMSFLPGIKPIWGVQDIYASDAYGLMLHSIHGWRMQLFFFISGFFTMMLWKKRGPKSLFVHRFQRILVPLGLAMVTIVPCQWFLQGIVRSDDFRQSAKASHLETEARSDQKDVDTDTYFVTFPIQDLDEIDIWKAVFNDDSALVKTYLDLGGKKDLADPSTGSTLLHAACFYGKLNAAMVLIESGASQDATNQDGLTPEQLLGIDWETTKFVASIVGIKLDQNELNENRKAIGEYINNEKSPEETTKSLDKEDAPEIPKDTEIDIWKSVLNNDADSVTSFLASGGDVNTIDPSNGSTILHAACFFGKADAAIVLINAEADLTMINQEGATPEGNLYVDLQTTAFIASMLAIKIDPKELDEGRKRIAAKLSETTGRPITLPDLDQKGGNFSGLIAFLMFFPLFNHLWFLWFLWWFVLIFITKAAIATGLGLKMESPKWIHTPLKYLILIPLAAIPQFYMARMPDAFGPDTSIGLLPMPAVFFYYLIFFLAGARYFSNRSNEQTSIPVFVTLIVFAYFVFLAALSVDANSQRLLFSLLQSTYAWMMTFGMIGLFSYFFAKERYWVRYLSDSSYWLYLAHLPLVLYFQYLAEEWQVPSIVKFTLIIAVSTTLLLISYQFLVRNTLIGQILNGRRYPRRNQETDPIVEATLIE